MCFFFAPIDNISRTDRTQRRVTDACLSVKNETRHCTKPFPKLTLATCAQLLLSFFLRLLYMKIRFVSIHSIDHRACYRTHGVLAFEYIIHCIMKRKTNHNIQQSYERRC